MPRSSANLRAQRGSVDMLLGIGFVSRNPLSWASCDIMMPYARLPPAYGCATCLLVLGTVYYLIMYCIVACCQRCEGEEIAVHAACQRRRGPTPAHGRRGGRPCAGEVLIAAATMRRHDNWPLECALFFFVSLAFRVLRGLDQGRDDAVQVWMTTRLSARRAA